MVPHVIEPSVPKPGAFCRLGPCFVKSALVLRPVAERAYQRRTRLGSVGSVTHRRTVTGGRLRVLHFPVPRCDIPARERPSPVPTFEVTDTLVVVENPPVAIGMLQDHEKLHGSRAVRRLEILPEMVLRS